MPPLVSVGVVLWNSATHISTLADCIVKQQDAAIELIVVDNASADDGLAEFHARCPQLKVIQNDENRGYCGAHNQAICASQGKYYMPLNPDVALQPHYIAALVETLESHPDCGSAAGKLLRDESGVLDTTGLFLDRKRHQYLRGHGEKDKGQYDSDGEVFGVDGAAPLYRREMLERIKIDGQYFDQNFFAHKEDVDLAWRAQIAGWKCWYNPQATAIHPRHFRPGHRATISAATRLHAVKNRYLLLLRNESSQGWRRDGIQILWYDLQIALYLLLFEQSSLAAFALVQKLWPNIMIWRKQIQATQKARPEQLLEWFQ